MTNTERPTKPNARGTRRPQSTVYTRRAWTVSARLVREVFGLHTPGHLTPQRTRGGAALDIVEEVHRVAHLAIVLEEELHFAVHEHRRRLQRPVAHPRDGAVD